MLRTIPLILLCSLLFVSQSNSQDVSVPRQLRKLPVIKPDPEEPQVQLSYPAAAQEPAVVSQEPAVETAPAKKALSKQVADPQPEKTSSVTVESVKPTVEKERATASVAKEQSKKPEVEKKVAKKEPTAESVNKSSVTKAEPEKVKGSAAKEALANASSVKGGKFESPSAVVKGPAMSLPAEKEQRVKLETKTPAVQETTANVQLANGRVETAATRLASGFDFPVGKPDAEGYYKARGYRSGGHMGEDWDGVRGGDTDLGDSIYSIGDGVVVFARDVHLGWGNVVIVRHAYKEDGEVKHIDSLYGHLNSIMVKRGQRVARGQEIGSMGTAHGQYDAHLHLEIRKNLEIGMSKSKFQKNLSNYFDPSQFINSHRHLSGGGANFRIAMNTFTHDSAYHFDRAPNFAQRKRSTVQSAAALRRAQSGASVSRE